ncbi:hypothetical protein SAMN02745883_02063 [Caminicella sporogenes DSM 14501]|uniref:Uncharacterized protein n=1 Tax=Caminicella sporogenes DSM 14501 TaxID=1121266 RepID=A0A1M6SHM6_9FIRM|nr:hypothetical protein [Caminicella sporogenes]RKD26661.1 hypothetical protein BET04_10270 [Caminicella sporogenes]SHK44251.1 hypothetical protein SAMN02745883_02063 [Caminicella sporogenes DSM 14501]
MNKKDKNKKDCKEENYTPNYMNSTEDMQYNQDMGFYPYMNMQYPIMEEDMVSPYNTMEPMMGMCPYMMGMHPYMMENGIPMQYPMMEENMMPAPYGPNMNYPMPMAKKMYTDKYLKYMANMYKYMANMYEAESCRLNAIKYMNHMEEEY